MLTIANYREKTIERLCELINYLDDNGCLTESDQHDYERIMNEYEQMKKLEKCCMEMTFQ